MINDIVKSKSCWFSIFLIVFGISTPLWIGHDEVGLTSLLHDLREHRSGNTLMLSTIALVFLNSIRALPHIIGAFLLGNEIGTRLNRPWLKIAIPIIMVPTAYSIINIISPFGVYFGGSPIALLVALVLLHILGKGRIRPVTKSFILAQFLFGFQWLNTVPFLTEYGFGRGPTSMELKNTALELSFDQALNFYGLLLCIIFVVNSIVLSVYLVVSEQKWIISQELTRAQMEALQSRSGREALHLVHDLKTPLTTIEGLNSLIQMKTNNPKIKEYSDYISQAIESTSGMVSEILHEHRRNWCSLEKLMDYAQANRLMDKVVDYHFIMEADGRIEVNINKIRFTRAIVNLIDNAVDAVKGKQNGRVVLRTYCYEGEVFITVEDNGKGMSKREIEKIWEAGYSTKLNPGIGLTFVRSVIETHGAELFVDSKVGEGTTFCIKVNEVKLPEIKANVM
ncbi:sensor histidine kinase KdpD [Alkalihalobacillus sp. BA299]|uniref:sensor histidine kinase n=1 Tax=Alkalihalobacillus sp. BA299 TaxID=2815938 RepID=UPI001ADB4F77|nr:HAMP domain-containing sensor histidine kinase [Alkalihalobacillus sp. BA299]